MTDNKLYFKYTDQFNELWQKAGLTNEHKIDFETAIKTYHLNLPANNHGKQFPGAIVPGTGGAFKYRYADSDSNGGKSGSYRTIYFAVHNRTLWFVGFYGKSDKESLTDVEKADLLKFSKLLKKGIIK